MLLAHYDGRAQHSLQHNSKTPEGFAPCIFPPSSLAMGRAMPCPQPLLSGNSLVYYHIAEWCDKDKEIRSIFI